MLRVMLAALLAAAAPPAVSTPAPNDVDPLAGGLQQPLGHDGLLSMYVSTVDGVDRNTTVTPSLLPSVPSWAPDQAMAPVPLSISEAVIASRTVLAQSVRNPSAWGIAQVALERFHQSWFYVVRWRPIAGGTKDFLQIPVTLAGRPIPLDEPTGKK